jgi:hypothetical protein
MAAELNTFVTAKVFQLLEMSKETGELNRNLSPIKRRHTICMLW